MSVNSNIDIISNNSDDFDIDEFNHYLALSKKSFPDVDLSLIQFSVASYLIYDVKGIKRPDETNEEFIRVNNKIEELIKNTKQITKEIEENQKKACEASVIESS